MKTVPSLYFVEAWPGSEIGGGFAFVWNEMFGRKSCWSAVCGVASRAGNRLQSSIYSDLNMADTLRILFGKWRNVSSFPGALGRLCIFRTALASPTIDNGDRLSKAGVSSSKTKTLAFTSPTYRTIPRKIDDRSLTEEIRYQRFRMAAYKD